MIQLLKQLKQNYITVTKVKKYWILATQSIIAEIQGTEKCSRNYFPREKLITDLSQYAVGESKKIWKPHDAKDG